MTRASLPAKPPGRSASIDWARGIVMLLMVVDHASMAFNADRFATDSAGNWVPGTAIPPLEFAVRWITHLCAPTFVFLAGTAMALMVEKRLARGMEPRAIDRDMLIRGVIILLVDPLLISAGVRLPTFQVMYAIGGAMIAMVWLRHLRSGALVTLALGWIVLGEFATGAWWDYEQGSSSIPAALLVAWLLEDNLKIIYPLLPWLAMMMLGWAYGRHVLAARAGQARISPLALLIAAGLFALLAFAVVRYQNGYGNMFLYRDDNSVVQWLHVSKYPPSLAFTALELGLLWLMLATLMITEKFVTPRTNGALLVFGQTAFFFYVVHRVVFDVSANWLGLKAIGDLQLTLIISAAMIAILYPCCRWYRSYKRSHPDSVLRFF